MMVGMLIWLGPLGHLLKMGMMKIQIWLDHPGLQVRRIRLRAGWLPVLLVS
jgi:hypothetical protein